MPESKAASQQTTPIQCFYALSNYESTAKNNQTLDEISYLKETKIFKPEK